eukprot:m.38612 g.38612  ORF g.38612 m.38612 type:complete len:530 (-) comp12602_c0_seq1:94-1683(-)
MSFRRKLTDRARLRPTPDTLDLHDQTTAYNWRFWLESLTPQERTNELNSIKTVKVNSDAWSELLSLKEARIENLWLTSVSLSSDNFGAFCQCFITAATHNGELSLKMIESFDLKFLWATQEEDKQDLATIAAGLCWFNELLPMKCHLRALKIYVTVDAKELQLQFWDRFLATPGLRDSVHKLVVLTNSRNIFAVPYQQTVGLHVVRYISQWRKLRELSLHGLWTKVQAAIIEQVPLQQLSLLSITPLPETEVAALGNDVLPHMSRSGAGQVLGFYGVNGVPDAVKPFVSIPTNILVIDLTTVRKPNGQSIVRSLANATGPYSCTNLYFRRKGSKEPLEDLNQLELLDAWEQIIQKAESIVFECRFDFDTSTTKVWDATFLSIMTAISNCQNPCKLKRLRFEECLMDATSTGYEANEVICSSALENMPMMMDLHIPLTVTNQYMGMFGMQETVGRRVWTPANHMWCDAELIRKPFFDITLAMLEVGPQFGLPNEFLHLLLKQCFALTYGQDPQRDGEPYLTEVDMRDELG